MRGGGADRDSLCPHPHYCRALGGQVGVPSPTPVPGRFKAKLWLCEDHPLSLCEQVAPIIDLMAISNALFAKLRDFITLRLPPGFPVKIGMDLALLLTWLAQPASLLAFFSLFLQKSPSSISSTPE